MTRPRPTSRLSTMANARAAAVEAVCGHVIFGSSQDVLEEIRRPEINLAAWRRDVPSVIAAWLRTSSAVSFLENCNDMDVRLPAACATASVAAHFAGEGAERRSGVSALARDVGELAEIVVRVTTSAAVRLRLEWVTEQACRYFHFDRAPLRLVCSYCGPGTEWVSNDVAARLATPESAPAAHDINRLVAGDVAIMRGSPDGDRVAHVPLRHRSPPIKSPSERRLFLAIDPA